MHSVSFSQFLERVDVLCEYSPLVSTISGAVNIIQRSMLWVTGAKASTTDHYWVHIKNKPLWRPFLILLPFVGNIAVWLIDYVAFKDFQLHAEERKLQQESCREAELALDKGQALKEEGEDPLVKYQEALALFKQGNVDPSELVKVYDAIGLVHYDNGDYKQALGNYYEAVEEFTDKLEENSPHLGWAYFESGRTLVQLNKKQDAFRKYFEAAKIFCQDQAGTYDRLKLLALTGMWKNHTKESRLPKEQNQIVKEVCELLLQGLPDDHRLRRQAEKKLEKLNSQET